jgi:chaperone modulatory protein CbpM
MTEHYELLQILDEHTEVAFAELLRISGFERDQLLELIECGVLEPRGERESEWRFPSQALAVTRRASRLRSEFELDSHAVALALGLLDRIDDLQRRVHELECQLLR